MKPCIDVQFGIYISISTTILKLAQCTKYFKEVLRNLTKHISMILVALLPSTFSKDFPLFDQNPHNPNFKQEKIICIKINNLSKK